MRDKQGVKKNKKKKKKIKLIICDSFCNLPFGFFRVKISVNKNFFHLFFSFTSRPLTS